jgi:hypothetical protein
MSDPSIPAFAPVHQPKPLTFDPSLSGSLTHNTRSSGGCDEMGHT